MVKGIVVGRVAVGLGLGPRRIPFSKPRPYQQLPTFRAVTQSHAKSEIRADRLGVIDPPMGQLQGGTAGYDQGDNLSQGASPRVASTRQRAASEQPLSTLRVPLVRQRFPGPRRHRQPALAPPLGTRELSES